MRRRLLLLCATMGTAFIFGGCSGGGAARSPEQIIKHFEGAANDGDWARACEVAVPDDGCEALLRQTFSTSPRVRLSVAGFEAPGPVLFTQAPDGFSATLERRDGEWLIHPETRRIQ